MTSRLLRALSLVWLIFASYAWQFALERIASPFQRASVPLERRRRRVHERNAQRLLTGILRLQGVYVKFGQVLSLMVGFLPGVYRRTLTSLQDAVPPRPFAEIDRALSDSLGNERRERLASVESDPVAAASLGQVHLATLLDGRKVAVKVLYPNIREVIEVDMRVLRFAMWLFGRLLPMRDLESVHDALADLLRRETDYLHEANAMRRMARNFAGSDELAFPEPIEELTTREVLTMTFMSGIKITHADALRDQGIDTHAVGKRLLACFLRQLFVHRYFHADPHPGNFLVQKGEGADGFVLVLLDFGAVSEAPDGLVEGMIEALVAFVSRDGNKLLRAFDRMGFVAQEGDRELVDKTVLMYFERLLGLGLRTPKALMDRKPETLRRLLDPDMELRQLRELARSFQSPEGWFYIERALVMMFGLCGNVAPELDLLEVAFPYVMPLLQNESERHRAG